MVGDLGGGNVDVDWIWILFIILFELWDYGFII